jgi:glycosyltransferase involved in cell wall biosynthesis
MGQLRSLWDQINPALVHAHDVKASIYLLQSNTRRSFPLVSTHHGVHGRPDWITRLYERIYRRYFLKSFDRVLCVSSDDYAFLLNSGVEARRLRLHLNGADGRPVASEDREKQSKEIRELWFPHAAERGRLFLFGALGRLSSEKDHARLFQVLSLVNRAYAREWRCLVFGSGPLEEALRRQVRSLGLEKRIVWMGYRKEAGAELCGVDLLLSFSKAEGLPISLIEAGWAGTPVMATSVGGVKDLIPDESYGNSVPVHEPAAESARRLGSFLLKDGVEKLRAQGKRFQERVTSKFTRKIWVDRLAVIYSELNVKVARTEPESPPWSSPTEVPVAIENA